MAARVRRRASIIRPTMSGPGRPLHLRVQNQAYMATIGCLVSDGHTIYALTNRHVTGEAGEVISSSLGTSDARIGVSAGKELKRLPFTTLYPSLPGRDTFVNLDIGLIALDRLDMWTPHVPGIGVMGPMVDYSDNALSLSLVGCRVRGIGAAGGDMRGEVHGLFYRYKTTGGFEYVADLMIGPRAPMKGGAPLPFTTLPGDSGTLWMLEPMPVVKEYAASSHAGNAPDYRPLAIQWGRNMLQSAGSAQPQGFALATLLSRVCALLDVDLVRDWGLDQADTWGALGHFAIATRAQVALSAASPKLKTLMANNAAIISRLDDDLAAGTFTGLGSAAVVPMADVPDFFWKPRISKQGFARQMEGPNHFADMDQKNPDGDTLLDLSKDDAFIDPDRWNTFYDQVRDLLSGDRIAPQHRGLLPFRVWQIFDQMVSFVENNQPDMFVCAAGVLTHYLGDACQPLHISYLHDGDPEQAVTFTHTSGKHAGESEQRPLGQGVHSAYEDDMIFDNRVEILRRLRETTPVTEQELVESGFEAAKTTIALMRATFAALPPRDIVNVFLQAGGHQNKRASAALWQAFGQRTIGVMQDGAHLVALLWESAWRAGNGEVNVTNTDALTTDEAMTIVQHDDFLPSVSIDKIGVLLKGRQPEV